MDQAIADTVEITMAIHDDPYSISGACAVAAAVSEAMRDGTSVYRIIKAAHYGSVKKENWQGAGKTSGYIRSVRYEAY